ncbi:hypothetical protein V9K67_22195 [Paraflavisolibacter sp. H34]|uniref:hypothetical protein n=1 Tax=Huijunlia imazamoxiresistens TaxID=3127457 RepID=UPI00301AED16
MNKVRLCLSLIFLLGLASCTTLLNTPKYQFTDGYYTQKVPGQPSRKVYVDTEEEDIRVYSLKKTGNYYGVDTGMFTLLPPQGEALPQSYPNGIHFHQKSFDVDFLSILFKYRPPVQGFPNQFTTSLNGAVYLGYRTDVYSLDFTTDPLGCHSRETNHYGFSFGGFTGVGATAMNPWVTNERISIEYDGVVWSKGLAGILGLNRFTVGLALGWDHLLDRNKRVWIYQQKPWAGLAFGLNLN